MVALASSSRPCLASHRGEYGSKNIPLESQRAQGLGIVVGLQEKGDSGNNLDTERDSPLSVGVEETTTVTDPISDEETPSCTVSNETRAFEKLAHRS